MMQYTRFLGLFITFSVLNIHAMMPKSNERYQLKTINNIPDHCAEIIETLLIQPIFYDKNNPNFHGHRVLGLTNWSDCQIISILSKNTQDSFPISSFGFGPDYNYANDNGSSTSIINYGIKCLSNNNSSTIHPFFEVIDQLQRSWSFSRSYEYYRNPYKEFPADNPQANDTESWVFMSKRKNFLLDEPTLIRFLAAKLGMVNVITCRATMTNDFTQIAGIHLWVHRHAFKKFQNSFCFELFEQ